MSLLKRKRMTVFFSFLFFLAIISFLLILFPKIAHQATKENQLALEHALYRASIQCYAIEGRYPPRISYLKEHYGIIIVHTTSPMTSSIPFTTNFKRGINSNISFFL